MRSLILATALAVLGGSVALAASPAFNTRYTRAQLGGIGGVLRYTVARPDREETRFVFLSAAAAGSLPEEVQVLDPSAATVQLADEKGADCTLAHVEIVTGRRPVVASAVRITSPNLADDDQSAPAPMSVQLYRPVADGDVGRSAIVLRASGPPSRTRPLCDAGDVRRAMLAQAMR